jgi:hypothetical protein
VIIIYKAGDLSEAHIVAGMLNARGIEAFVGGHYLQGGIGDLPAMNFIDVRVADEDVAAAQEAIREYEGTQSRPQNDGVKRESGIGTKLLWIVGAALLVVWLHSILQ